MVLAEYTSHFVCLTITYRQTVTSAVQTAVEYFIFNSALIYLNFKTDASVKWSPSKAQTEHGQINKTPESLVNKISMF